MCVVCVCVRECACVRAFLSVCIFCLRDEEVSKCMEEYGTFWSQNNYSL